MDQERAVPYVCEHGSAKTIEGWEDVPPVSEDCGRARCRIVERAERLRDELARPAREAAGGLAP
jgi:hypothetical protein